jgi:hypothetical protein
VRNIGRLILKIASILRKGELIRVSCGHSRTSFGPIKMKKIKKKLTCYHWTEKGYKKIVIFNDFKRRICTDLL